MYLCAEREAIRFFFALSQSRLSPLIPGTPICVSNALLENRRVWVNLLGPLYGFRLRVANVARLLRSPSPDRVVSLIFPSFNEELTHGRTLLYRPACSNCCCLPPNERALIQRQQVIVPIPIRVCAKVGSSPRRTHDSHVRTLSRVRVQDIKCIRSRLNARDCLFTGPFPPGLWIPYVGDVLVRTLGMGLSNASYLYVRHWVFIAPCPARISCSCGASGYGNPLLLP